MAHAFAIYPDVASSRVLVLTLLFRAKISLAAGHDVARNDQYSADSLLRLSCAQ